MLSCLTPERNVRKRSEEEHSLPTSPPMGRSTSEISAGDASLCKRYVVISTSYLCVRKSKEISSEELCRLHYGDIADIAEDAVILGVKRLHIAKNGGWISESSGDTKLVEFLCDTCLVVRNRVISTLPISVRSHVDIKSDDIGNLFPGEFVSICPELSLHDGTKRARRADGPGWITAVSSKGEPLLEETKKLMRMKVISPMMMNIRKTEAVNSEEVGSLMPGAVIEVCDERVLANGTKRVRLEDHSGWVTYLSSTGAAYLEIICSLLSPLSVYESVSSMPLSIRKSAETDSEEYLKGECTIACKSQIEVAEVQIMSNGGQRLRLADGRGWVTAVNDQNGDVYALKVYG